LKFKNNSASAKEQSLKFSVKAVNKTAISATQLAKRILLHAYSSTTASSSCARTSKNFMELFDKL